jgi:hypothetical protein
MKNSIKYLLAAPFVVVTSLIISCGRSSDKFVITLYEIENGDTIAVEYEPTPEDFVPLIEEGYQYKEDSQILYWVKASQDKFEMIEHDMNLFAAYIKSNEKFIVDKSQIFEIPDDYIKNSYGIVCPLEDFLLCGILDKDNPNVGIYTLLDKKETYEALDNIKKEKKYDASDETLFLMRALAGINSKQLPYYAARNFESKSGIFSRIYLFFEPLENKQ